MRITIQQMMGAILAAALGLFLIRLDTPLGVLAIGIALPACVWTLDACWRARKRGRVLPVAVYLRIFLAVLVLTLAVYAGVILVAAFLIRVYR